MQACRLLGNSLRRLWGLGRRGCSLDGQDALRGQRGRHRGRVHARGQAVAAVELARDVSVLVLERREASAAPPPLSWHINPLKLPPPLPSDSSIKTSPHLITPLPSPTLDYGVDNPAPTLGQSSIIPLHPSNTPDCTDLPPQTIQAWSSRLWILPLIPTGQSTPPTHLVTS